jgi:uncharacterized protein (TIGR03437 family)
MLGILIRFRWSIRFCVLGWCGVTSSFPNAFAQQGEPSWIPTGKLSTGREYHTATVLPDGRVLVIGGEAWEISGNAGWQTGPKKSAEVYDPDTLTWHSTGSLNIARSRNTTATLLPTGQVLVTGGSETGNPELYDPATGRWRTTSRLITARSGHTATLLPNGRVLIVGGAHGGDSRTGLPYYVRSAELYDPATETWSNAEAPAMPPAFHDTLLLPSGNVLTIGLRSHSAYIANKDCTRVAELYNPATGRWSASTSSPFLACALGQGYRTRATPLASGLVLVTGGGRADLYDPATGEWSPTPAPTLVGSGHTLTLLANGQVLVTGGHAGDDSVAGAELYDSATGTWIATTALSRNRAGHSSTFLPNGKVLIVGGFDGVCCDWRNTLDTADLFDLGQSQSGTVTSVSAASYGIMGLAPDGVVVGFGNSLATASIRADTLPPPVQLAGTTVKVTDSAGVERLAPLLFVSPTQVSYQIPSGTAAGAATVTITSGDGTVSTGVSLIHTVAPSLFTANGDGQGVAAAVVRRLSADGSSLDEPIASFDAEQNKFVPRPIDLGPATDRIHLILSGTGIRFRSSLSAVIATIGGAYAEVISTEAQPDSLGIDQVELLVPRSLAGRGEIDVLLTVDAQMANPVRINIQ